MIIDQLIFLVFTVLMAYKAQCMHFYLMTNQAKCFNEDLDKNSHYYGKIQASSQSIDSKLSDSVADNFNILVTVEVSENF